MLLRPKLTSILVALLLCLRLAGVHAHEFTLDAVMNVFVKIDAHEAQVVVRAPLYLFKSVRFPVKSTEVDVANSAAALERALVALQKDVSITEDGRALVARSASGRLALPSDRSFESYEEAIAHIATPIEPDTHIVIDQGYVDAHLVYPISSPESVFAFRTTAGSDLGSYLRVALRFIPADGEPRAIVVRGGAGAVDLNPSWFGAAAGFIGLGIAHIVTGIDHLMFLMCLVIPLRGWRPLLTVITGFTVAHSFTLIGSAFGLAPHGAWFPPFVELVIAVSIVYTALENIIGVDLRRRVLLTLLFGLVHGFGFSYGLQEQLQFAGTHLLVSLLAFNVGIEIGQLMVLTLMLPALALVTRYVLRGRAGSIILAALLAHAGWHWMTDRWDALAKARWPQFEMADLQVLLFWAAGLAIAAGAAIFAVTRLRLEPPARDVIPADGAEKFAGE